VVRGVAEPMTLSANLEGTADVIRAATLRSIRNAIRAVVWAISPDATRTVICTVTRRVALLATHETTDAVTLGRTLPVTDKTKPTAADGTTTAAIAAARHKSLSKRIGRCAGQRPRKMGLA
jgi:hypothetical protein